MGDGEADDETADVDLNDVAVDDCDEAVGIKMCKRMTMAMTWKRTMGGSSHLFIDQILPSFPLKSKRSQMLLSKCRALVPCFSCALCEASSFRTVG